MFGMPLQLAFTSRLVPAEQAEGQATNSGEQGLNSHAGAPYAVEMGPFLSPWACPASSRPGVSWRAPTCGQAKSPGSTATA
jgi:quinoprotein glucose dehydrogenase